MTLILNTITNLFKEFEAYEKRSNPYNKYAEQLPPESEAFAAWQKAHEDFDRPQRFRAFLSSRPELVESVVQSVIYDDSTKEAFENVAYAVFERVKDSLSLKGSIKYD